jgi:hypothetical protein
MRRREFITLVGGGSTFAWVLAAHAQQPNELRRIGVLSLAAETDVESQWEDTAFRKRLDELGWINGRNVRIESREKLPSINKYAFLECSRIGLIDYKFNFVNHRFIEIYKGGYINGANDNNDTPKVSGGDCTLAQSIDAPKPSKYSMKSPRRGRRGL